MAENEPIIRECRDCRRRFEISADEQALFARLASEQPAMAWVLPRTCASCRALRRQVRETVRGDEGDLTLRCVICGCDFSFLSRDRAFFAECRFRMPRRCPRCRAVTQGRDQATQIGSGR